MGTVQGMHKIPFVSVADNQHLGSINTAQLELDGFPVQDQAYRETLVLNTTSRSNSLLFSERRSEIFWMGWYDWLGP